MDRIGSGGNDVGARWWRLCLPKLQAEPPASDLGSMPINPALPPEKRDEIAKDLKAKLSKFEILLQVSHDLELPKKWNLASDEEAAQEISARLFVKVGEADGPMGKVPAINIGLSGKTWEKEITEKVTLRLMEDVWKLLGIKPPTSKATPPF